MAAEQNNQTKEFYTDDGKLAYTASYDDQGREKSRTSYDDNGKTKSQVDYTYHEDGRRASKDTSFREDGTKRRERTQDFDGTIRQITFDSEGKYISGSTDYDKQGKPVVSREYNSKGLAKREIYYEYHDNGQIKHRETIDATNFATGKGNPYLYEVANYDENGTGVMNRYDEKGKMILSEETIVGQEETNQYLRNENGQLLKRNAYRADNSFSTYVYEEDGSIHSEEHYDKDRNKITPPPVLQDEQTDEKTQPPVVENQQQVQNSQTENVGSFGNTEENAERTANTQEVVGSFGNGEEETKESAHGLDEGDLLKQSENLRHWLKYYELEGAMAKPPYASPFEKINACKPNKHGGIDMELGNGNRIINNANRIDLAHKYTRGEKPHPTLEECMSMVRMGQQKGWTAAKLTGTPEFQKQMYLACRALGMPVKDFVPTAEMLKEGAALEDMYNSKSSVLPQTDQEKAQGAPEKRLPTLIEKCQDLDARFPKLEKVREAQPVRKKTKEDPYPDLANFDTMREAEKKGLKPKNARYVDPAAASAARQPQPVIEDQPKTETKTMQDDTVLRTSVTNGNKEVAKAMTALMQAESKKKESLLQGAETAQRDEWRKGLAAVEAKEAKGEKLTKADANVKAKAEKYKIMTDPEKEQKVTPKIDRKDFGKAVEAGLKDKEKSIEIQTVLAASILQREAAANGKSMIETAGATAPKTAAELLAFAQKEVGEKNAAKLSISEMLQEAGRNKSAAKTATAENAQKYREATGKKMPEQTASGLSKSAKVLDARIAALKGNTK